MDFVSPPAIIEALQARVAQGTFGYGSDSPTLRQALVERMQRLYGWSITPDAIVFLPGLVSGLNVVTRAIGEPGTGVLVNTPVYPPFLTAPINQQRQLQSASLQVSASGPDLYYAVDEHALAAAVEPNTRLFILCNPHNPVGRAYTKSELLQIAAVCEKHNLVICSDEIHCDLLLGETRHIPIASLAPEIAERTITLMAPSKTFNIPGLGASLAIVPNPALRRQLEQAARGIVPHLNVLGVAAAEAAYTRCDDWLRELLAYLKDNRDFAVDFVKTQLPEIRITNPEATYLLWLDCRAYDLVDSPCDYFIQHAKVALNDGKAFGEEGTGFVRLNFGSQRATLAEGLEKLKAALVR